jgi:hemerythrin-like domain-containing protein
MTNPVPGHAGPSAGFEVPLEMLAACHARIERQCATLRRLVPHLVRYGSDAEAREAAANVMHCFDTSARHHHADEEEDLFPALIESMAGSDAVCVRALIDGLVNEHRELEARWQRVRSVLEQVGAGERVSLEDADVEALVTLYRRHIEREESELLPMAARLLSDEGLDRVGRGMRERRGLNREGVHAR